ncbi:uncharacterized protein LOC123274294 [Cotesia glomerata]|uniref:uncharacterized protein LOC123274294 n=1 Tax=Cotesia glomerata TaxID=32391 RepID=UPI001D017782|nr:uncharacterized protein LOC123274294 [Cotesia glomerata]
MGKKVSPSMRVCSRHFTEHDYIPSDEQTATISSDNNYNDNLQSFEDSNNVTEQRSDKEKSREKVTAEEEIEEEKEEDLGLQNDQLSGIEQAVKTFDCGIQSVIDKIVQNLSEIGINIGDKIIFPRLSSVILTENSENNSLCSPRKKTVTENNLTLIKVIEKFELCTKRNIEMSVKKFNDVGTQVRTDNFIPKFSEFISNDHELSTLTGIPNFCLLYTIKKLVDKQRPPTSHSNAKLDSLEVIIMTFMKLKQNMSYALLAILFKSYTPETCKDRIFHMIDILYKCLKPAILWPSKENILKNIPLDFVGFENVRAVIDCTEILIQRPKNLCCQIVTYSRYKSSYTVKFMTAVTPAGLISFISKPYGGRASDNAVFEQSEIIKKFDKKDAVMTDRGFTVDDLCQKNDVKLISPPFLKDKKQFSKMEAMNGRKIAKARVHVERSNQRIKIFEILSSKMPIGLVHKIEEIFTIICAIVNLSQPILKDEKFIQD